MSLTDSSMGVVIATRTLRRIHPPRRTVVVSLGKPRRSRGSPTWECPFRITGLGLRGTKCGYGVDAFQALVVALEGIRYYLDRSGFSLAWAGVLEDQSGFQRLIPVLPDPKGTRRLERLVDREMELRLKRLMRRHQRRQKRV